MEELNTAHGLILYKGHKKEKTSDRAYRTISSCPFLAKGLDLYLRDLYQGLWDSCQAPTQYQGTGSSHELASLLVTEVIQHSLYVKNKPVFLLSLDAQSAFDRCLRQILVGELYKTGMPGSAITVIDKRLEHRATVYDWNGELMGPGRDKTGFEQGGINSGDFYKLYNNEQLITGQNSELGVDIGSSTVSNVGQADDVFIAANDIDSLALLVRLTEKYCSKYRVTLVPSKTKILVYHTDSQKHFVHHQKAVSQVTIAGESVKFVTEAEHVGVIRNTAGNLPNILHRITAHKNAMRSVLHTGMAQGHRGNPAASLRVHKLYGTGVLFSGLATLVMSPPEIKIIDHHYQQTIQNLQKLHDKTPRSLVLLMAGSLPGEAILHIKQLTLFSMICHLPSDPLHLHGKYVLLSSPPSARSWFQQILTLCMKYCLSHPHYLLTNTMPKNVFKRKVKSAVIKYWEDTLRHEAASLDSLHLFVPTNCNLQQPHPLWTTAGSNSFECHKSIVLAKMISGRFRTEYLSRHWTSNKEGYCQLETCSEEVGNLEHLLISCPGLEQVRSRMREMILSRTRLLFPLKVFIARIFESPPAIQMQFLLEPLAFNLISHFCELYGQTVLVLVYYCVRTYVYYVFRQKQILLGLWLGDMTIQTKQGKKSLTFRKFAPKSLCNQSNDIPIPGLHCVPDPTSLQPLPRPDLDPRAQMQHNTVATFYPAAVTGVGVGGAGLLGDTGQSAVLDCGGGVVGCGGGGRVTDCCLGSQCDSYSEITHTVVALASPASNTIAGIDELGQVVQLSSSPLIPSFHHHQSSGTQ